MRTKSVGPTFKREVGFTKESSLKIKDVLFDPTKGEIEVLGFNFQNLEGPGHFILVLNSKLLADGSIQIDFVDPNFEGLQQASITQKGIKLFLKLPKNRYYHYEGYVDDICRVKLAK